MNHQTIPNCPPEFSIEALADFFNHQHDKLVATVSANGEPNISIMGTPRIAENGAVEFEISDPVSVTLENMKVNKGIVFMCYLPAERARDFTGARIQAEVVEIITAGEKNRTNQEQNQGASWGRKSSGAISDSYLPDHKSKARS
jgi:hypothetical protein